ncbi:MAG: glycosyltransferase [Bacteroidota bacterium]|nr:glycosyltransferase [Bacteroidota bacterium]
MNEYPLVSVLMTAYNREKYISEAIESVLASTYINWELIIVDDCSTDNTLAIAREYEKKDPRIQIHLNKENLSDYPNRNKAASYAKGKYLKYLDSDDVIFPEGIQYCVEEMEKFADVSMGILYLRNRNSTESFMMSSEEIIRNHFFKGSILSIGPSGSIYNRNWFELNNGFDIRFGVASDNYFNIQMAAKACVVLLPKVFFDYRVHDEQQNTNEKGYLINNYLYNKELYEKGDLPLSADEILYLKRKLQKRHLVNISRFALKSKEISNVIEIIKITKYKWWNAFKYILY